MKCPLLLLVIFLALRSAFINADILSLAFFWLIFALYISSILKVLTIGMASLVAQLVKNLPAMQETQVQSLGKKDPLEKEMATHSSTLAWKIPWTEESCRLQSIGLQRVRHDWATSLSFQGTLCLPRERLVMYGDISHTVRGGWWHLPSGH